VLVLVEAGSVVAVVAVVAAGAAWFFAPPPASADEHATRVSARARPDLPRPLGRLSILITAFDSVRPDIVPHFFHRSDNFLQVPLKSQPAPVDTFPALGGSELEGVRHDLSYLPIDHVGGNRPSRPR
jgi:hypothetical protein